MAGDVERSMARAAEMLAGARRVLCLTGSGVSAESGIATFRDAQTGLWATFDPEQLASQRGFRRDPGLVWGWYMERLGAMEQAQPNPGHRALAALQRLAPTFTLATQNIDDLHERAGSADVLHLHGSIARFHCNECGGSHGLKTEERTGAMPPVCAQCGGWVRPSVVWFGEMLPERVFDAALRAAAQCDVALVVGTSGIVFPAAQLPFHAQQCGAQVIDVNPDVTPISEIAAAYLQGAGGDLLPRLLAAVEERRG